MNPASLKLNAACFAGNLEEAKHLLDDGADPNSADEHGCGTLLSFHPEIIEYLLSRGADPNIQKNQAGASVLAGLAYVNQFECVRLLLNAGANVHRGREESDETPLHHALVSRSWNWGQSFICDILLLRHIPEPSGWGHKEVDQNIRCQ